MIAPDPHPLPRIAPKSAPVSAGTVIRTFTDADGAPWECRRFVLRSGVVVFCHNLPRA
jgi:hypothetical protein